LTKKERDKQMGKSNNKNQNHPKKGDTIVVSPIRNEKDIKKIKRHLKDNKRNLLLFTLGINNGIRVGDILDLKVGMVRNLKPGETLTIRENKTKKLNVLMINKQVYSVLQEYLEEKKPDDDEYLFQSRNGKNNPLTISTTNNLIKEWCKKCGLKGNYGNHTLRKTFGYHQRMKYGVGFEILCKRYNHSSPSTTMRYLGIEDKEINGILLNEI